MTILGPSASLNEAYAPIQRELKEFSEQFKKSLGSEDPLISQIHEHILSMTGKFLRPALVLLTSRLGKSASPDAVMLAVAIELIHTATLVHDDIIDDSELRRNQPAVHTRWGRDLSIVAGDYLYAKAFLALAGLKNTWINEAFATCAHVICEGEMKQIEKRNDFLMSEEQYLRIIHQKTAALFQASCVGGAFFSGLGKERAVQLGNYGLCLGMAFQIVDDCLDIVGETEKLGKSAGNDIYKNDITLPLLYLFHVLSETERNEFLAGNRGGGESLRAKIKARCLETRSIEKAMAKATSYIDEALAGLDNVPESVYREGLVRLAQHCLERAR
jgi:octaprenyl-diphosphate synthase